jgi:hypothetical protein
MPTEPATTSRGGRGGGAAQIGREAREKLSAMMRDVMLNAADAVEAVCPIRTGHLLSNFILSTRSPYSGVAGSPEAVSYAAQDAGREKVLRYDVGRDGRIYLTNHVEYLKLLPPFVSEAMQTAVRFVPRGQKTRVRSALKAMARSAIRGGK